MIEPYNMIVIFSQSHKFYFIHLKPNPLNWFSNRSIWPQGMVIKFSFAVILRSLNNQRQGEKSKNWNLKLINRGIC